jgi:hypothetical protein
MPQVHRGEMTVQVVHSNQGLVDTPGQRLRDLHTHQQRSHQARPLRDGDRIDAGEAARRVGESLANHRNDRLHVRARCQLRNDATVRPMRLDLTGHHIRQNFPCLGDQRSGGFVARALDAEHPHQRSSRPSENTPK